MTYRRPFLLATLASLCLTFGLTAAAATVAHASPPVRFAAHAVALSDATAPPTELVYLYPGAHVTYVTSEGANLSGGRFFTETSAYTWQGRALGAQQWTRDHTVTFWRTRDGGRVTFDGITFRNRSRHGVLVAAWAD